MIRFRFSPRKAYEGILWMLAQPRAVQALDLHCALKAFYFADKSHLSAHLRPITGATYRAMQHGPVPVEIYEMLKGEEIHLLDAGIEAVPWRLGPRGRIEATQNAAPDLSVFSETDLEHLTAGYARSASLTFNTRTRETHGPDWSAARMGWINPTDMLDDTPDKAENIAFLRENAHRLVL